MMLQDGNNILVAHRRLFEKDETRFFIGRVDNYESGVVKVTGHSFVRDLMSGQMIEKKEPRTKILSLSSGTLIVYQLPEEISLDTLKFASEGGRLLVTDGKSFTMNLAEFTHGGQA